MRKEQYMRKKKTNRPMEASQRTGTDSARERTSGWLTSLAEHVLTFLIRREMQVETTKSSWSGRNHKV